MVKRYWTTSPQRLTRWRRAVRSPRRSATGYIDILGSRHRDTVALVDRVSRASAKSHALSFSPSLRNRPLGGISAAYSHASHLNTATSSGPRSCTRAAQSGTIPGLVLGLF